MLVQPENAHDTRQLLDELETEERIVSSRRRRLQDRIDFVRGGGANEAPDQLQRLIDEEHEISARRRDLHGRIDELRRRLGLTPGPSSTPRPRLLDR